VVARLTSGATTAACTANTTNYIYATYVSAASVTWGTATLQPLYQSTAPTNTNGQYWFDTTNMQMKLGNGTTWAVVNAVFVGEAVAGASTISSVVSYAYQGRYDSGAIATLPGPSTAVMLNHNLGTKLAAASIVVECLTSEQGYAAGTRIINPLVIDSTASSRSIPPTTSVTTKVVTFATNNGGGPWTALPAAGGAFAGLTNANWAYRVLVSRSF